MSKSYCYHGLLCKQTNDEKRVLLFSASSVEIAEWAGIPQKTRFGDHESNETIGFQREENQKRIQSLERFFSNTENIIQNPLLCATRTLNPETLKFEILQSINEYVDYVALHITIPNYSVLPFQDLLRMTREYIESRVPDLVGKKPKEELIIKLKEIAKNNGVIEISDGIETADELAIDSEVDVGGDIEEATAVLFEESHIFDFWEEVAARHELSELIPEPITDNCFLGFSREALAAYIYPVVLVDGQHRLRGAVESARSMINSGAYQEEITTRVVKGESVDDINNDILKRESRWLPVSLLISDNPAEQVFQFVVVNQKATPIGTALLGTIVSTTLSNDEMERVATRLKDAGIELEESQAITYLARYPESPFFGLVERGMAGDGKDLLQWPVFSSLVTIFKDLKGGKIFGEKNPYAQIWRNRFLNGSPIVEQYQQAGCSSQYEYWSKIDGPWRDVFIVFWRKIRDFFATTSDPEAFNFWGRPRQSNLFNKVSLTILSADFFQYLVETKSKISSVEDIPGLVDDWLENVNNQYFNRNWDLSGVKKDAPGIRNQWAFLWVQYRKNPDQFPQSRLYKQTKSASA